MIGFFLVGFGSLGVNDLSRSPRVTDGDEPGGSAEKE
jgi:hypothetical protein